MKKVVIFILYVIMVTIIFTGCNLKPLITDQFDLRDTVTIQVDEKLYENKNLWVRLDSIIEDSRCPEGAMCFAPGAVETWFSVWLPDTLYSIKLRTDSLKTSIFVWSSESITYWLTLIDVEPERIVDQIIAIKDYRINFVLEEGYMVYKPNIYLYPKMKTKMDVSLEFPQSGHVTISDPDYPDEWQNIKVTPCSKIDGKHDFLFYEAALPDRWQYDEGWSVKQQNLKTFSQNNLTEYGFNKREIADFTDYWIPRLKESPYYAIYPQHTAKIDEVVKLNISKTPKSILRLFYVIKDIPKHEDMSMPLIPEFERKGFTVTEWGVIL